ncbi:DEAD/DEAH box helicase [Desulfosporosinus metallidurans]|uniref:Helicase conserved C-terminal domain protein n=1 Tax=Desulfosporosinus metallidurans TaxID=1888891 RepID=A0A1Q8QYN7_9FIRM|nr:DEAD/DEAH box helicase [Desulfosporosinus metallidurans]OLN32457.1 Helicase conserved C-terminal domain protein [Desulfosporosinus metallidurans]
MSEKHQSNDPQTLREYYIRSLATAPNPTQKARELADDLFALDLTVYSNTYSLDSVLYSALAESVLDDELSLHPEQIEILNQIKNNDALIVSAPTSFGKTYCIFEYITRYLPQNIVLIVPTLALVDEYVKRVIKKYQGMFSRYKIHTHIDEAKIYDFNQNNIFIITHDRVVQESAYDMIKEIDFLVIDEVYKLETDPQNDRVLVLNMAYFYLAQKAQKYVLLAPFIKSVEDIEQLEKRPAFYNTTYSPVVNEVRSINILRHDDRYPECQQLLVKLPSNEKTLIYFPTVTGIYKYVNDFIAQEPIIDELDQTVKFFMEWAREEIHEDWCVIKAMERGYLIHNGQIPIGTRLFQLNFYESSDIYNRLLCTSTLLEGVNTTAKNIIITKPSRMSDKNNNEADFSAFDFYNLVGRTGRLNKHFIGTAYYLKSPTDPEYKKIDAIKSIKFELTDESKDIDIQKGNIANHPDVIIFLQTLGITIDEYLTHIGSRPRFKTVREIYYRYQECEQELLQELQTLLINTQHGRLNLVKCLYYIAEGTRDNYRANIVNSLIHRRRPKIKTIVDNTKKYFASKGIDNIISTTISIKMSFIEHQFYTKVLLVRYFMGLKSVKSSLLNVLDDKVIGAIEYLYFSTSKQKKMLLDLGIYERDIDLIIKIIGNDFDDIFELKKRLQTSYGKLQRISFISRYVIRNIV